MGPVTIGVDLGQKHDPTAIVVVELCGGCVGGRVVTLHVVRHLERLPLGTSYLRVTARLAEVARAVCELAARTSPQCPTVSGGATTGAGMVRQAPSLPSLRLYVDATGLGQPVVDLLRAAGVRVRPVFFTHGDARAVERDGTVRLGKAWLVSRLQVLLQTGRLLLPRTAEAEALAKELLDYEIRIDARANDTYGAFKVGAHDDLVTAVGLATQDDGARPFNPVTAGPRRDGLAAAAEWCRRNPDRPPPDPRWR